MCPICRYTPPLPENTTLRTLARGFSADEDYVEAAGKFADEGLWSNFVEACREFLACLNIADSSEKLTKDKMFGFHQIASEIVQFADSPQRLAKDNIDGSQPTISSIALESVDFVERIEDDMPFIYIERNGCSFKIEKSMKMEQFVEKARVAAAKKLFSLSPERNSRVDFEDPFGQWCSCFRSQKLRVIGETSTR